STAAVHTKFSIRWASTRTLSFNLASRRPMASQQNANSSLSCVNSVARFSGIYYGRFLRLLTPERDNPMGLQFIYEVCGLLYSYLSATIGSTCVAFRAGR